MTKDKSARVEALNAHVVTSEPISARRADRGWITEEQYLVSRSRKPGPAAARGACTRRAKLLEMRSERKW